MTGYLDRVAAGDDALDKAAKVIMPFGAHKGRTLGWVLNNAPLYLDWLVERGIRSDRLRAAVQLVMTANADYLRKKRDEAAHLRR